MLARIQKAYVTCIFLKNLIKTKPKVKQCKWYNVYRTDIKCKTTPSQKIMLRHFSK